ncbi:D-amino-acid transaminase [Kordiimonas aestuarii]|uniref:D-amino-acid transaminase n=1 Tax=Kordiimonas aestuarii TaxID=1005925 RepID=UPI0021D0D99C|nr:D-amino-acid transaminase [Kordiimonas aestuarii]
MSRISYVNGAYVPHRDAAVHIDDRGYQFADAVYEGVTVRHGRMVDLEPHLERLWRSMGELRIAPPMERGPMRFVFREVIRRNRIENGFLYIQISRGVARRDHAFPTTPTHPSLIVTLKRLDVDGVIKRAEKGVKAFAEPDIRWGRCDVKSTSLLPNILAKQAAKEKGGFEAVLVDRDGFVTEGSSTNMWIVKEDGTVQTRATTDNILPGITRATLLKLAGELQIRVVEEAFTLEDARGAAEMFLSSSTGCATPIVELDGHKIGDGTVGPVAKRLVEAYRLYMEA